MAEQRHQAVLAVVSTVRRSRMWRPGGEVEATIVSSSGITSAYTLSITDGSLWPSRRA